jgi:hypothetical protein
MDPVENGRRAQAALRRLPRITGGKIDVRREVAEPSQADTSQIQGANPDIAPNTETAWEPRPRRYIESRERKP